MTVEVSFVRALGARQLFSIAFGAILGAGWFVALGQWLGQAGSLGTALGFIGGAAVVAWITRCYADIGTRHPAAGGEVIYALNEFSAADCHSHRLVLWQSRILRCVPSRQSPSDGSYRHFCVQAPRSGSTSRASATPGAGLLAAIAWSLSSAQSTTGVPILLSGTLAGWIDRRIVVLLFRIHRRRLHRRQGGKSCSDFIVHDPRNRGWPGMSPYLSPHHFGFPASVLLRRRSAKNQPRPDGASHKLLRAGGRAPAHPERDAHRRGHADRRRAADHHGADRFRHFGGGPAADVNLFGGQFSLIDHHDRVSFAGYRGQHGGTILSRLSRPRPEAHRVKAAARRKAAAADPSTGGSPASC